MLIKSTGLIKCEYYIGGPLKLIAQSVIALDKVTSCHLFANEVYEVWHHHRMTSEISLVKT